MDFFPLKRKHAKKTKTFSVTRTKHTQACTSKAYTRNFVRESRRRHTVKSMEENRKFLNENKTSEHIGA